MARLVTGNYVFEAGSMNGVLGQLKWESVKKRRKDGSFFPQTIRDWNDLPDSPISSAEMSDDCVSKFASLVRARD